MNLKNIAIVCFILLMTVPFILITDIFPFLRFGMFAESPNNNRPLELFISQYKSDSTFITFNSGSRGLDENKFNYLARNYYYRNEGEFFLSRIDKLSAIENPREWRLLKITIDSQKLSKDTSVVAIYAK
ncbi:MAG: hypothetical protein ACK40G_12640 [Cytophagaceae bacterium]